jgi:hypothetical protein
MSRPTLPLRRLTRLPNLLAQNRQSIGIGTHGEVGPLLLGTL